MSMEFPSRALLFKVWSLDWQYGGRGVPGGLFKMYTLGAPPRPGEFQTLHFTKTPM